MPTFEIYSELDQFNENKGNKVVNLESVFRSINNLLNTDFEQRIFLPNFGSGLEQLVFQPVNEDTEMLAFHLVVEALETWEPRVDIIYSQTEVEAVPDYHKFFLRLVFEVEGLEEQQFEISGYLGE